MTSDVPLLSVRDVTVRFGGLFANSNISFDVPEGALFAVIGPNGAGKTTLFNVISGAFPPTEGQDLVRWRRHHRPAACEECGPRASSARISSCSSSRI